MLEFFNLAGQLVENGSFDKLSQKQPLLLAVVDAVFTTEGGQEVVKPEQDRDLARAKPGASSAIVRPLTVRHEHPQFVHNFLVLPSESLPSQWIVEPKRGFSGIILGGLPRP